MQIPRKVTKWNIWKTSVTISDNCFWVWCCLVMPGDAWCNLQELFQRLTSDPSSVGEDVARIPAQQILAGPKLVVAALFPRRSLQSCRTA